MKALTVKRNPEIERLVPSVNEESILPLIDRISTMEPKSTIKWDKLKDFAGWPKPKNATEHEVQRIRHSTLVESINRWARKLDSESRFQLRSIRKEGVEVLKGDAIAEHRSIFEKSKIENASKTAVKRLSRELEAHQENMTRLGRFRAKLILKRFEKLSQRAIEDLEDMLVELEGIKLHWKNGER